VHRWLRGSQVQAEIANRCIELLSLPEGKTAYVLDVGCGSGLSGQVNSSILLGKEFTRSGGDGVSCVGTRYSIFKSLRFASTTTTNT